MTKQILPVLGVKLRLQQQRRISVSELVRGFGYLDPFVLAVNVAVGQRKRLTLPQAGVEQEHYIQSILAAIELFFACRLAAVAAELRPFWYLLVTSLAFHMFSLLPFEKRRKNPLRFSDMT